MHFLFTKLKGNLVNFIYTLYSDTICINKKIDKKNILLMLGYTMILITIDNLIVISVVFSMVGTYFYCTKNISDNDSKKNSDLKFKNSPKSFSDFSIFNDEEMFIVDENRDYSKSTNAIQNSNLCSNCNQKLYKFNSIDYFAYDKQYCRYCWQKINYRLSKKY